MLFRSRRPVGYRRAFLDDYQPNDSFLLPQELRTQLHRLGRSPVGDRPAGTYARQVLDRLLIDLSWASSRLEGNTYRRLDTQNLLQFGQLAAGKDQLEAQMILNHKAAIAMMVDADRKRTRLNYSHYCASQILSSPLKPTPK